MPARIDLPEIEVLEMYRQKPDVFSIAAHFHVSDHPIRRILRNHGAMLTLSESLKMSPKAKESARRRCDQNRPQLTGQDAEDCRLDRAWEAREKIADVVYCRECLFAYADLTNDENQQGKERGHLWSAHGLSGDDYQRKHPGMRTTPWKHQAMCDRNGKSAEELMKRSAEEWITADQLRDCRLHPGPEWDSSNHIPKNRTVCRDCGYKAGLSLYAHLRDVHGWDRKQYRAIYPKAPMRSVAYLEKLPIKLGGNGNTATPKPKRMTKETRARIVVRAYFKILGKSQWDMAKDKDLYPNQNIVDVAYKSIYAFDRDYEAEIDAATARLVKLDSKNRRAQALAAQSDYHPKPTLART